MTDQDIDQQDDAEGSADTDPGKRSHKAKAAKAPDATATARTVGAPDPSLDEYSKRPENR